MFVNAGARLLCTSDGVCVIVYVQFSSVGAGMVWGVRFFSDDPPFIVLTETKFSFRCIPVWDQYSPNRTRVEKKTHVIMLSP